jgi:aminopeptidase N
VHESGHEWFGNNITARDMADNWIHEGITTFSESLFAECLLGKEKAKQYCIGSWHYINNDQPVIGHYGVNEEGGGDIYEKGAAIMQMIRQITNDDEKFRQTLRGLGKDFYHQTVTTRQVEDYIALHTGLELKAFFNQYLRTTDIPEIEYGVKDNQLSYRFNDVVAGFSIPLTVSSGKASAVIKPKAEWQHIPWSGGYDVKFPKDYLIKVKE